MKNIEIEIQVKIEKEKVLKDFLKKNANFQKEICQKDKYFSPKDKDYTEIRPIKKWLRLRDSGGRYFITYKKYYFNREEKSTYCNEYETRIEDIEKFKKILKELNFQSLVVVHKTRKIWNYKDYEISIDSVKNLGSFVEIEYIGNNQKVKPEKVANEMINFLKRIGCGIIKRNYTGYPFQLLFPKEVKFEKV